MFACISWAQGNNGNIDLAELVGNADYILLPTPS